MRGRRPEFATKAERKTTSLVILGKFDNCAHVRMVYSDSTLDEHLASYNQITFIQHPGKPRSRNQNDFILIEEALPAKMQLTSQLTKVQMAKTHFGLQQIIKAFQ